MRGGCDRGIHHNQREVILALYSAVVRPSGVMCPLLGSPVQERYRLIGANPAEGRENYYGIGASIIKGEAESTGAVQLKEKAQGGSYLRV